jgi:steroid 5-alpha reductase family enzyme
MTLYFICFLVCLTGFWLLWPVSILKRDVSIVDFWWAPGFAALSWVAWAVSGVSLDGVTLLVLALVTVWGLRLGVTLSARRLREGAEDARYQEMRALREPGFWWKSFFIVFTLQAVVQFVVGSVLIATVSKGGMVGPIAAAGALVAIAGALIEARSEWELDRHKREVPHGGLLTTGLRAHVRYPSYSGEILFWSGIALIGLQAGVLWAPLNAVLVAAMLVKLSGVAILEDRFRRTRPGFAAYANAVPALVPRLLPRPATTPEAR